jgi:hypothetical protein
MANLGRCLQCLHHSFSTFPDTPCMGQALESSYRRADGGLRYQEFYCFFRMLPRHLSYEAGGPVGYAVVCCRITDNDFTAGYEGY